MADSGREPTLAEAAYEAGRAGGPRPRARTEQEQRVVDGLFAAGRRDGGQVEPGSMEEWELVEGRIIEAQKRRLYGLPPEPDSGHDPGG